MCTAVKCVKSRWAVLTLLKGRHPTAKQRWTPLSPSPSTHGKRDDQAAGPLLLRPFVWRQAPEVATRCLHTRSAQGLAEGTSTYQLGEDEVHLWWLFPDEVASRRSGAALSIQPSFTPQRGT